MPVVTPETVDRTITSFTRLDQRGDKKAMHKLAQRLQKEQPHLLQFAAAVRDEHGDTVGEAAVFYATLIWAMYDRAQGGTLQRLTTANLAEAQRVVTEALAKIEGLADRPAHERAAPELVEAQPYVYAKLAALLSEDVKAGAMTTATADAIALPTQVVVEAFDAAMSGRRPGERQGTVAAVVKVGRNEPCPCGSGKKFKKCHGGALA
jgi:uncharacterized protein